MKACFYDRLRDIGVDRIRDARTDQADVPAIRHGLRLPKEPRARLCRPLLRGQAKKRGERQLRPSREML